MKDLVLEHYELRMFSKLIKLLMSQVEVVNEFVSLREPWVLAKNENQHIVNSDLHQICSTCLHAFRLLSIFLTPIIPDLTSKVALFFKETPYDTFSNIEIEANAINKYEHLMQRLESKDIEGMVDSGK
jgi:methionyl-tRNA synthetase